MPSLTSTPMAAAPTEGSHASSASTSCWIWLSVLVMTVILVGKRQLVRQRPLRSVRQRTSAATMIRRQASSRLRTAVTRLLEIDLAHHARLRRVADPVVVGAQQNFIALGTQPDQAQLAVDGIGCVPPVRSEERRVGKEGRSRWLPYQ